MKSKTVRNAVCFIVHFSIEILESLIVSFICNDFGNCHRLIDDIDIILGTSV